MGPRQVTAGVRLLVFLGLCAGLTGCQTAKPIYHWGNYEALMYQGYAAPGKKSPAEQIESLKADLEKARAANQPAPPGLHAYLGYLYIETGQLDLAAQELTVEKTLFPESTKFVDGLLNRMQGGAPKK